MDDDYTQEEQPCFVISIAAKLVNLHPQTLRYYDRIGLISPSRTAGRRRLYSQRDVEILRRIARLTDDLGVNLAGVEVVLNMSRRIEELQDMLAEVQARADAEISALYARLRELEAEERGWPHERQLPARLPRNRDEPE
jgi:MerR family transcriptional regulator/heat shock protein HspR